MSEQDQDENRESADRERACVDTGDTQDVDSAAGLTGGYGADDDLEQGSQESR